MSIAEQPVTTGPTHLDLPDTDGKPVENTYQPIQSALLTAIMTPGSRPPAPGRKLPCRLGHGDVLASDEGTARSLSGTRLVLHRERAASSGWRVPSLNCDVAGSDLPAARGGIRLWRRQRGMGHPRRIAGSCGSTSRPSKRVITSSGIRFADNSTCWKASAVNSARSHPTRTAGTVFSRWAWS